MNVTEPFLKCIDEIKGDQVVLSHLFDLLEGTRAVEVSNPRLDTGLIPLNEDDLNFDTAAPRSAVEVISIMDEFLCMTMSWLENSSLPVTALSCRYAQTILQNYQMHPESIGTLVNCSLEDIRLKQKDGQSSDITTDYMLVHRVLRSYFLVLLKWIGFCVQMGLNVLYEEEDLTTRTLDLDLLSQVPFEEVKVEAQKSINWISAYIKDSDHATLMQSYLSLSIRMLDLYQIVSLRLSLTHQDPVDDEMKFILEGLGFVNELKKRTVGFTKQIPKGTFSKFIQLDLNNKSIPTELTTISTDLCFNNISSLFNEVLLFVTAAASISNIYQLNSFLEFYIRRSLASANVISRGLFQIFFVRDDRSILGSRDNITTLTTKVMENFSCSYSHTLRPDAWNNIQGSPAQVEATRQALIQSMDTLLGDIETGYYQALTVVSNNRCRQRQLNTRAILIWDTIQVSSEPLEVSLWQAHRIGDKLMDESPALAITSFVYFMKLDVMLEVLLLGFELDVYKPYEMNQMYWFATYLSMTIADHLKNRVLMIVRLQIHEITEAMPKRIKKTKAGTKKQQLKDQHQYACTAILPSLQQNEDYLEKFLVKKYEAMRVITDAYRMMYALCHSLGLIDAIKGPKNLMTTRELLYKIRMKPWSSVGVPSLPTYEQYLKALTMSTSVGSGKSPQVVSQITSTIARFNEAKQILQQLSRDSELARDYFLGTQCSESYTKMSKSCVLQSLQLSKLKLALAEDKPVTVLIENKDDYFPYLQFST